jgi:hypothetical protein
MAQIATKRPPQDMVLFVRPIGSILKNRDLMEVLLRDVNPNWLTAKELESRLMKVVENSPTLPALEERRLALVLNLVLRTSADVVVYEETEKGFEAIYFRRNGWLVSMWAPYKVLTLFIFIDNSNESSG